MRMTRVLRMTTEINRLDSIFDSDHAAPSHFTKRCSGNGRNSVAICGLIFRGTPIALPEIALRSPPRTPALVPKQGRATAVGPPTCGSNGSPAVLSEPAAQSPLTPHRRYTEPRLQ